MVTPACDKSWKGVSICSSYQGFVPTTKVVWAEVVNFAPSSPVCGSSWSVIRNTRFIAVFGALVGHNQLNILSRGKQAHPSRMTQLQLVNTSPNGACPFKGGN